MHWKLILLFIILMLVYAGLGGIAYHVIESSYEAALRPSTLQNVLAFMQSRPCLNLSGVASLKALLASLPQGGLILNPRTGALVNATNWDIQSGIFLASQVLGAVGYGTVSPHTVGGRVFLVVYTCFGIPLFIVFAFALSRPISRLVQSIEARCCYATAQPADVTKIPSDSAARRAETCRVVFKLLARVFVLFLIGSLFFVLIPAAIFNALETWTYPECIYFAYVSVLSVGFGDYIPGNGADQSYRDWYRLGTGVYLYISVAFFVVVFTPFKDAFNYRSDINKPLDLHEPEPIIFQGLPGTPNFHRRASQGDKGPANRAVTTSDGGLFFHGKGHAGDWPVGPVKPLKPVKPVDNGGFEPNPYDQYQSNVYPNMPQMSQAHPSMPQVNQAYGNLTRLSVNM